MPAFYQQWQKRVSGMFERRGVQAVLRRTGMSDRECWAVIVAQKVLDQEGQLVSSLDRRALWSIAIRARLRRYRA